MDYKFTFEDGSEAIAHFGTKGMKWGVWNDETRAKYSGGDSSYKGAKKTVKDLNRLDSRKAVEVGRYNAASAKAERYLNKVEKAVRKGTVNKDHVNERASKYATKYADAMAVAQKHKKAISGIQSQQESLTKKLAVDGYNVSLKNVRRSTSTKGEKAMRLLLGGVAGAATGFYTYSDTYTTGTKYKLGKSK